MTRVFHVRSHSKARLAKIEFFEKKRVQVATYSSFFSLIVKENKIRNKTLYDLLFRKNMSTKTEYEFEDQVIYWKCMMVNRNTPLNSYTYSLY